MSSRRKRSADVRLVLLCTLALSATGCDSSKRYLYANREDCIKEWGEAQCEPEAKSSSGSFGRYYTRPMNSNTPNPLGSASKSIGIQRGGFGSLASHFSSGS